MVFFCFFSIPLPTLAHHLTLPGEDNREGLVVPDNELDTLEVHLLALGPPLIGFLGNRQVLGLRVAHLLEPSRLHLLWETYAVAVRLEVLASEVDELLPLPVACSVVDATLNGVVVLGRESCEEIITNFRSTLLLLGLASGDLLGNHRLNLRLLLSRGGAHLLSKGHLRGRHVCVV